MRAPARILALLACLAAPGALAATATAEIVSVEGRAEYREAQQTAWRAAAVKQSLFPTNFVRTLDLSRMAILFADRTQIQLAPNSTLQIKEIAGVSGERTIVNLNRGKSWMQSKTTPKGLTMETPSALAAIRGTDWEMIVDDDGRSTLSVFSGEVELSNEYGAVLVAANEQARAERGRAPVKLTLQVSRERIQWVSSFSIDRSRHPGEELPQAYERLKRSPARSAGDELLLADIEIYRGELSAARAALERGAARFPADERFDVALARVALLSGDVEGARQLARRALGKRADSVDALVMLGDIERRAGRAREALAAYSRAVEAAARDPRGWYGLGVVEGERENLRRARSHLAQAIALDPNEADYHGELGTVEGFAGNLAPGREALMKALTLQPDNYVALTGLGVLELKSGNAEAAADALLRATLIEPRYSRAHLYLAAAYYEMRRDDATLAELELAAQADPNDPLPHVLAGIVHMDRIEPGHAAEAARRALERIPYLKSLNQVADNQKGVANVGFPLAFMGLESWARSAAHESYLPFWGGSHLFLADRYPGAFNQRSELAQGFITDPLAFGASNRFQSLFLTPGHHATATMRYGHSDDIRVLEPSATFNGYSAARVPFAYFGEVIETRIDPGNVDFEARGRTYTVALGAKPTHEIGLFLYYNRLAIEADIGRRDETGEFSHVNGTSWRVDAGARIAPSATSSLWIKAGTSRESSHLDQLASILLPQQELERGLRFDVRPDATDGAIRHTFLPRERLEITSGAEAARRRSPRGLVRDETFHFVGTPARKEILEQTDTDRSETAYAVARWGARPLLLELGVQWSRYRIDRDILATFPDRSQRLDESFERRHTDPMAGITWRPNAAMLARAACRRWLRPATLDTLAPVAIAGMPLDDQLVFGGGRLEQCRAYAEWTPGASTHVSAFFDRTRVHNVVSGLDGILNTGADITNLDRLRNRALTPPPKPDLLEDTPVYAEGVARRASLAIEQIVARRLAVRLHYTHSDTENTDPGFPDRRIPYVARHQVNLGFVWTPAWRSRVSVFAVHRSRRFADESNNVPLAAGWDAQVSLFTESRDKRWSVEFAAVNLLKKEVSDFFVFIASYRF